MEHVITTPISLNQNSLVTIWRQNQVHIFSTMYGPLTTNWDFICWDSIWVREIELMSLFAVTTERYGVHKPLKTTILRERPKTASKTRRKSPPPQRTERPSTSRTTTRAIETVSTPSPPKPECPVASNIQKTAVTLSWQDLPQKWRLHGWRLRNLNDGSIKVYSVP